MVFGQIKNLQIITPPNLILKVWGMVKYFLFDCQSIIMKSSIYPLCTILDWNIFQFAISFILQRSFLYNPSSFNEIVLWEAQITLSRLVTAPASYTVRVQYIKESYANTQASFMHWMIPALPRSIFKWEFLSPISKINKVIQNFA